MRESHRDVVTGKKIFARDLRAKDIGDLAVYGEANWGNTTLSAFYLRATLFDHAVLRIDVSRLQDLGAIRCVVKRPKGEDDFCEFYDLLADEPLARFKDPADDYLVTMGNPTKFVGQPVCLLVFEDREKFLDAQREKQALADAIEYSDSSAKLNQSFESGEFLDEAASIFVPRSWEPDASTWGNWIHWYWGKGSNGKPTKKYAVSSAKQYNGTVSEQLDKSKHVLQLTTRTSAVDTGHLEPDSALGRVQPSKVKGVRLVELIIPTQSHSQEIVSFTKRNTIENCEFNLLPCRLGGGFGGRSASQFGYYAALAALAGKGLPVRLEYDRLEQFVAGIKRHPSRVETRLSYNKKGEIDAFESNVLVDGGSVQNLSGSVAKLSRHSTLGAYRTKKQTGRAAALKNSGVLSGSMRGFGIPQALFNIEQQIDRLAAKLGKDPVAYRKQIAIKTNDPDIDGKPHRQPLMNAEVLDAASQSVHWKSRDKRKADFNKHPDNAGKRFGTGMAFAMEAYGTSRDTPALGLRLNEALEIEVVGFPVRMGQGTVDGLESLIQGVFGSVPVTVQTGQGHHLASILKSGVDTNAAAKGTFGSVHVFRQIYDVWMKYVWGPELLKELNKPGVDVEVEKIAFDPADREIHYEGIGSAPYEEIAKKVLGSARAGIFGLAKFKNTWAYGEFQVDGKSEPRWLARLVFSSRWGATHFVDVMNAFDPTNRKHLAKEDQPYRSLFASAACLVDTVVDYHGVVDIERVTIILDAGSRLSDKRIKAQIEGGIAQGLGHTLFEKYPAGPLGGQRQINFDRYAMPRLRHMPNQGIETQFVDPKKGQPVLSKINNTLNIKPKIDLPKELYKGISEVSISPIAPAIANAVIDAIYSDVSEADERRFTHWPITPNEVLQRMPEELREDLKNQAQEAKG
ncbi:xanthine dehydrogenase family protein molybdopterin-binding subunit [Erythrobacter sp. YT30]|uniref:xanthine dehydrogenase family protein molybdopterin-binding subunit n=1 Tax=Erythrobacter sp. YT30 TaxID=1735012 RepID=UPI00076C2E7C|nr:molybdopterin cofactor-binding domain-containing protein [Erythrobacter sp. YT30]KWV91767.1 hypothetical protein AUC45_11220 [Erythrobacter sp. YT30]